MPPVGGWSLRYLHYFQTPRRGLKKSRAAPRCLSMTGTDTRVDELREIGLPQWMLDLAGEIGIDAALLVWQRLSDAARERGDNRLHVPAWSTFLRYQRNRFILTLGDQGYTPEAIREQVRTVLCEQISLLHVKRILRRS